MGTSVLTFLRIDLIVLSYLRLASSKYLDDLPTTGNDHGRAFRDLELEQQVHKLCQVGATFRHCRALTHIVPY